MRRRTKTAGNSEVPSFGKTAWAPKEANIGRPSLARRVLGSVILKEGQKGRYVGSSPATASAARETSLNFTLATDYRDDSSPGCSPRTVPFQEEITDLKTIILNSFWLSHQPIKILFECFFRLREGWCGWKLYRRRTNTDTDEIIP